MKLKTKHKTKTKISDEKKAAEKMSSHKSQDLEKLEFETLAELKCLVWLAGVSVTVGVVKEKYKSLSLSLSFSLSLSLSSNTHTWTYVALKAN